MKRIIKATIAAAMLAMACILMVSCAETTPYERYDEEGYSVSIKYDANGGMFTTNVETIVDTYKLSELPDGESGYKVLSLVSPDDPVRGTGNYHTATNVGYFLAGWYLERTPVTNDAGEELDADGNVAAESGKPVSYNYSDRWDFENGELSINPTMSFSADEAITLYAAWIPEFRFEFYDMATDELLGSYAFNPNYINSIELPKWDDESGALNMYKFPSKSDMTLDGVYLDKEGKTAAAGESVAHLGSYDMATAEASDPVTKLYLDYIDGEWYRISTAKQFIDNISPGGCYEILADLDFEGLNWPTSLLHGNFRGKINGNGHVFKNISVSQTDTGKQNTGLFAYAGAGMCIKDVTFENCSLKIEKGTRQQDAAFGLLSGTVDSSASFENVVVRDSALLIEGTANFYDNTAIGLLCGIGDIEGIALDGISCQVVGDNPDGISVTVQGNEVTINH